MMDNKNIDKNTKDESRVKRVTPTFPLINKRHATDMLARQIRARLAEDKGSSK